MTKSLPARWRRYADANKRLPQVATRTSVDHYAALRKLAKRLQITPAFLARIILGLVIDGHTVDAQSLITERENTDD